MAGNIGQFTPLAIQSAIFFQGLLLDDPLSVAQGIQRAVGGTFDGQPGIFPVPPNVPQNVPRILLKDRMDRYQCRVCGERLDLAFDGSKRREKSIGIVWDEYAAILRQLAEYFKKKNPTRAWRLGLMVRLFKALQESAVMHICQRYLRDARFGNPHELHLSVLHRKRMEQFGVNRWLRVRPMRKKDDPNDDRGLLVDVDINTLAEEKNDFSEEEITQFFEAAFQHIVREDVRLLDAE